MSATVQTTEERINFVLNRIKERRAFAADTRQRAGWVHEGNMHDMLQQASEAEMVAEAQETTLRVLFPERF